MSTSIGHDRSHLATTELRAQAPYPPVRLTIYPYFTNGVVALGGAVAVVRVAVFPRDMLTSMMHRDRQSDEPAEPPVTRADLLHCVVHLRERGLKLVSCKTWIRAMNAFCRGRP